MPFGCVGSVHAWDRIGAFIAAVAAQLLHVPLLRYVDDYFTIDRAEYSEHCMYCFARIVRCLLGAEALAEHKLACSSSLDILGITVSIREDGVSLWPTPDKVSKWKVQLMDAVKAGTLRQGDAAKLVGRLSFGSQHMFRKLGRAMLRPIYCQQYSLLPRGKIGHSLCLPCVGGHRC